jgi:hypothetical protein
MTGSRWAKAGIDLVFFALVALSYDLMHAFVSSRVAFLPSWDLPGPPQSNPATGDEIQGTKPR